MSETGWRVDRKIPLHFILLVLTNLFFGILFGANLNFRTETNTADIAALESEMSAVRKLNDAVIRVGADVDHLKQSVDRIEKKIDQKNED